jgi:hypothetical protein
VIRVTEVQPLEPHWLRLWFSDGSVHDVDVGPTLARGGVFAEVYADPDLFAQARVEPGFGTVEWPGPLDLDPEVLHGDHAPAEGGPYPQRVVRGPRAGSRPEQGSRT